MFHGAMGRSGLVLMTDHGSTEGSRETLATAVRRLTGQAPFLLDARHFMSGGAAAPPVADACGAPATGSPSKSPPRASR